MPFAIKTTTTDTNKVKGGGGWKYVYWLPLGNGGSKLCPKWVKYMAEVELTYVFLHARFTTLNTVKGLTVEQLDYLPIKEGNSIGALLLHMAAVEFGFQIELFDKRNPNKQESEEWGAVYQLGELGRKKIKGNPLELYIEKMDYVKKGCVAECVILIYFICLVKLRK